MRLLAVVMSVAVVAGGAVWAQTQRTTPEPKTAPAPAGVDCGRQRGPVAGVRAGRRRRVGPGRRRGVLRAAGRAAGIERQRRRQHGGRGPCAPEASRQYEPQVERALAFVLQRIEASPADGLAITDRQGTQIQRKLGPYIDTFLSSMLMSQIDGRASTPALNARVRKALQKTVAKIEKHQQSDGSWNIAGGWAPVLGTSMASRSLFEAQNRGVAVDAAVLKRAETYTVSALSAPPPPAARVAGGGGSAGRGVVASPAPAEAAGVALYQSAQALEQLSRTAADRAQNAKQISAIQGQLANAAFVGGFGSMGGEEFFSYLNISDSMKRGGGDAWSKWHADITQKIVGLQNSDGTWAGHHCITGRVAMTSAAILNLTVDRAR